MDEEKRSVVAKTVHDTSGEILPATVIGHAGHGVQVIANESGDTADCLVNMFRFNTVQLAKLDQVPTTAHRIVVSHSPATEFVT